MFAFKVKAQITFFPLLGQFWPQIPPLFSFSIAQSTSFSPTPSIQQTFAVSNQTEMLNASMTTMTTVQHQITSVHVQPSSTEVSRPNSKIMSTPPSSTASKYINSNSNKVAQETSQPQSKLARMNVQVS